MMSWYHHNGEIRFANTSLVPHRRKTVSYRRRSIVTRASVP